MAKRFLILVLLLAATLVGGTALAHFKLNLNIRIFHVVHDDSGLDVYLRTPMAYLVADLVGPPGADGIPAPAPFTTNRIEDGTLMHLVGPQALRADPKGLGRLADDYLHIRTDNMRLRGKVIAVRVHPIGTEPGFANRAEAVAALASGGVFPPDAGETYVGNAVVDIHLRFDAGSAVGDYTILSSKDPGLPEQEQTANLILDYSATGTRTYRATGLMQEPVTVSGSVLTAASTFVLSGIHHILEGLDHVLFVLCLVIGAPTLHGLLARVTGFTLGHTVTLAAGFFGIAPSGAWFIPAVETAIALSIIYAAGDAILRKPGGSERTMQAAGFTAIFGLLHGFGFSFMLREILKVDAENVWQSLLAFNIGVEIGQLVIVAIAWPLVLIMRRMQEPVWHYARSGIAALVSVIAAIWVVERAGGLLV
jgi:hypothetical protein